MAPIDGLDPFLNPLFRKEKASTGAERATSFADVLSKAGDGQGLPDGQTVAQVDAAQQDMNGAYTRHDVTPADIDAFRARFGAALAANVANANTPTDPSPARPDAAPGAARTGDALSIVLPPAPDLATPPPLPTGRSVDATAFEQMIAALASAEAGGAQVAPPATPSFDGLQSDFRERQMRDLAQQRALAEAGVDPDRMNDLSMAERLALTQEVDRIYQGMIQELEARQDEDDPLRLLFDDRARVADKLAQGRDLASMSEAELAQFERQVDTRLADVQALMQKNDRLTFQDAMALT